MIEPIKNIKEDGHLPKAVTSSLPSAMKVLLLVFALVAAVSAQTEPWCRCAAFVTYEHSEIMVYEAPEVTIDSCEDDAKQCKNSCAKELNTMSNNGDLWLELDSGITVGQYICTYLADHFFFWMSNHKVYGYYEVCGGAWQFTGVESQQLLCCDAGKHEHCIVKQK
ncbi:uncharacterized protein LOC125035470 [Penaeus chinensis]|uniref:uncharacterized protein LOC125035470 n=1 Tax=Penaeus chinensis TaxID=139456 RepID=UPI001FB58BB4|nr:uncharacterized protein LOC125035470 [Penaeus chinensis]